MGKSNRKIVLLPIQVPDNEFCWDGKTPCGCLDSEGGHLTCDLNIGFIQRTADGLYLKSLECRNLKEAL